MNQQQGYVPPVFQPEVQAAIAIARRIARIMGQNPGPLPQRGPNQTDEEYIQALEAYRANPQQQQQGGRRRRSTRRRSTRRRNTRRRSTRRH